MQTGQRLASLVPLDEVYVDANFKETQLARLRPGQTGLDCGRRAARTHHRGTVESFSPASGAVFSLLPPDNATGNFTKIVQRLPVRIRVPGDVAGEGLLRPACRSWSSVNTKAERSLPQHGPAQRTERERTLIGARLGQWPPPRN